MWPANCWKARNWSRGGAPGQTRTAIGSAGGPTPSTGGDDPAGRVERPSIRSSPRVMVRQADRG